MNDIKENITQQVEIIKKSQMKISEMKSLISELKMIEGLHCGIELHKKTIQVLQSLHLSETCIKLLTWAWLSTGH